MTVKNTSTTTDAYVRTFIAVPSKLYTSGALQMVFEKNFGDAWELSGKYERYMGAPVPENIYVVFVYTYIGTNTTAGFEAVSGRLKAENQTISLLKGVYTSERADVREFNGKQHVIMWNTAGNVTGNDYVDTDYVLNNNREFSIFVNTQAVQADGFDSAADAFATAFGNKDPWDTLIPSEMPESITTPIREYIYD